MFSFGPICQSKSKKSKVVTKRLLKESRESHGAVKLRNKTAISGIKQ
jgi:hypothetical protein